MTSRGVLGCDRRKSAAEVDRVHLTMIEADMIVLPTVLQLCLSLISMNARFMIDSPTSRSPQNSDTIDLDCLVQFLRVGKS